MIPYVPSTAGTRFYTQVAVFSNANAFGLVTSNGLDHTLGL